MKEQWLRLLGMWDGLAMRERALVMGAAIAVLYGLTDSLFLFPMDTERKLLEEELARTAEETERIDARSRLLGQKLQEGIPASVDREERALRRQIEVLNTKIEERTSSMIPPGEVTRMIEALLAEESGLTLVKLTSLENREEPHRSDAAQPEAEPQTNPEFYRHGFLLELEGSYLATLHYLEAVESLSWDLSWDRIVYEVIEYPRARISIELHTLSDEENWIGV
ncbi:MAG: type II secretion system protein M [bacterium]|nr:type II secretion system protein M [bacterium]